MKKLVFTGLLLATFLTYSCESPDGTGSNNQQQEGSDATVMSDEGAMSDQSAGMSEDDREFLKETAKRNLYNLELVKLAQQKANTDDVKQLASNLESEHKDLQQQLSEFAQQKNVQLPDSMDSDQRDEIQNLAEKQGMEFDTEFMDKLVSRHKETVDRFESKAEDANDQELKQWAQNTLPTLRTHVQSAESVEAKVENKEEQKQGS